MFEMILAGMILLVTHFGMSSTSLRPQLVGVLGENGFLGVYSLVSFAAFGYIIWVYGNVPRTEYFWYPSPELYMVPKIVMPLASVLIFGGFLVRNPTQVGADGALQDGTFETRGMLRITRHPFMWGTMLWAASHIVANGDVVSVVFFATFFLLAAIGTLLIDRKKAAKLGEQWGAFSDATSNVPFAAILRGKNKFVPKELVLPALVGIGANVGLYLLHGWLSGVPLV